MPVWACPFESDQGHTKKPSSDIGLDGGFFSQAPGASRFLECDKLCMMSDKLPVIRSVTATRYVTPLREGGSLPAIVEADDDGLYVLKFRGAGQGPKALVAELLAGEIGRALGLPVPEIVLVALDPVLGRNEPDFEIRSLIQTSGGTNLGIDFLPGSLGFVPANRKQVDPMLASAIVWFDAYVTNVDRTARNPNMLLWHKQLWLIDHGAALYFHHQWNDVAHQGRSPFSQVRDHVLLPVASQLSHVAQTLHARLTPELLAAVVDAIPVDWLVPEAGMEDTAAQRAAYRTFLQARHAAAGIFLEEALRARAALV